MLKMYFNNFPVFLTWIILTAARAAEPFPCFPDQWEGSIESIGAQMDASSQYFSQGRTDVAFDFTNQRVATNDTFEMNGDKFQISVIMDYNENVQYEIQNGGECTTTPITQPMARTCVPEKSVKTGPFQLGVGERSTPATGFAYPVSAGAWEFLYLSPPASPQGPWVPVAQIRQTGISGAATMFTRTYTNISLGIRDVTVFQPPTQCRHPVIPRHLQRFLRGSTIRRISSAFTFTEK